MATWNIPSDAGVGVSGYMYYISNSPAFTSLLKSGTVSTTGVNIANFELGSTGTYYRYVVAKDRLGNV